MDTPSHNQVVLVGRVSAIVDPRTLPSGDEVASFRLVVSRSAAARKRSKQTVDTFDVDAWTSRLRRTVGRLEPGAVVRVEGTLRRQFTRGAAGPVSRVTVDLSALTDATPLRSET